MEKITEENLVEDGDDIDLDFKQLKEIHKKIAELVEEAEYLVRISGDKKIFDRARANWIPHIKMALLNDTEYLGKSMVTMEDTISEIEKLKNEEKEFDESEIDEKKEKDN